MFSGMVSFIEASLNKTFLNHCRFTEALTQKRYKKKIIIKVIETLVFYNFASEQPLDTDYS